MRHDMNTMNTPDIENQYYTWKKTEVKVQPKIVWYDPRSDIENQLPKRRKEGQIKWNERKN